MEKQGKPCFQDSAYIYRGNNSFISFLLPSPVGRVAAGKKILENEFFTRSGKSGNFVDGQGNLERT